MRHQTIIAALLLFGCLSGFGQTVTTAAHTSTTSLPPIGLASSETLQVNVANTTPASASSTPQSCTGSIVFYNSSGAMIGPAKPFTIASGQIFSAQLPYSAAEAGGSRVEIRAEVSLSASLPTSTAGALPVFPPACLLASSLETYDTASGVTHVFFTGASPQVLGTVVRTGVFGTTTSSPPAQ
jgi:hypothetical protein